MNIVTFRRIARVRKVRAITREWKAVLGEHNRTLKIVISVTCLIVLFGFSCLFGLLTIREASTAFKYLFVIFNGFQGFYFLLFICIHNDVAKYYWAKIVTCGQYRRKRKHFVFGHSKGYNVHNPQSIQTSIFKTATDDLTIVSAHNEGSTTFDTTKNVCVTSFDLECIPEEGVENKSQMELTSYPVESVAKECDTVVVTEPESSLPQAQQTRLSTTYEEGNEISAKIRFNQSTSDDQDFDCEVPFSASPQHLKQGKSAIPLQDGDQLTCL